MSDLKSILTDLSSELQGTLLEETFTVRGRKFTLRLLNAEENMWRNARIDISSQFSALSSWKLPTLAIGLRAIGGIPVEEGWGEDWLNVDADSRQVLESANKFARKYFTADYLMQFLSQLPNDFIEELVECWENLSARSKEAQDALKKSSGENSVKGKKKS